MFRRLIADGGNLFVEIGGRLSVGAGVQRQSAAAGINVITLPTMMTGTSARKAMDHTQQVLVRFGISGDSHERKARDSNPPRSGEG